MTQLPGFAVHVDETFALPTQVRTRLASDLGATAPADVLGMTVDNQATQQEYNNPNGSTLTAIAPAVLAVSFTAPASGNVTVELEAEVTQSDGITAWGLISAGVAIASARVCSAVASGAGIRCKATLFVEGLTAGQSYTFQWATAVSTGSYRMRTGGTLGANSASSGPAVMIVRDAPF